MAFYVNLKFYEKWMNFILFNLARKDTVNCVVHNKITVKWNISSDFRCSG